jgi:DNA-binding transcriptional ArsR family regulator
MREDGRYAYAGLDKLLHAPGRLSILTALMTAPDGLPFNDLQTDCDLTSGNLASHARPLEEAGLLTAEKVIERGRAVTRYRITAHGRDRFTAYLDVLQAIIRDASRAPRRGARTDTDLKPA